MPVHLIADSGATKAEWSLVSNGKKKTFFTQGISPYFLSTDEIAALVQQELARRLKGTTVERVFYYGTGCANPDNARSVKAAMKRVFPKARIEVNTDLMAAARALCRAEKGIACILGTGSNSCYYNGKKIVKNSPGIGYVLGDEGSGAYLGKLVVQQYLYDNFDDDLRARFDARFVTTPSEILENVYKKPLPNRYLASFVMFLVENRGHQKVEEIIRQGLDDFFARHLRKYEQAERLPVNFVGSVALGFKDVLHGLCNHYGFKLGTVLKNPMPGLVRFHHQN